ncbi:MAG: hypothetical protein CVT74_07225 [Alphaproteobacteria bacterium HGW-Alphaproteobacteria-13]|jgi:hypothetical protein|nr:MAG: hypothetical protein CVT74_07225 [Alphaproteobacteria bacterium HGW-Alphaproteobacteria-13]
MRRIAFAAGAGGLALAPLAGGAQLIAAPACGGGTHLLVVPADPAAPKRQENCAKACHAATDRRGKAANGRKGCC